MIYLHAHILPGLDDGPERMEQAVAMCRLAADDGTSTIVATPHMFSGMFDVGRNDVLDGVRAVQHALNAEGIPLKILPGGDVHAHADLVALIRSGEVMTVADGHKYVMVELSHQVVPPYVQEMLFSLQLSGVTPILTHPERNLEVQHDVGVLLPMVRAGNLVQITAASLCGDFGSDAELCAKELLRRRMAHLVASDAHSLERRPPGLTRARAVVEELVGADYAQKVFEEYPERIVAGASVSVPDPVEEVRPRRKRIWAWWKR